MSRKTAVATAVVLAALIGGSTACHRESLPSDHIQHTLMLMNRAWGPESPDTLQKYLEVRQALKPVYAANADGLEQHSLREASTRPILIAALKGLLDMRREADAQLATRGLTMDDYLRLTILVYGRWLRAVRSEDPPEKRVTRVLQELEVAVSRRLEHSTPGSPNELKGEQDRLASIRHQLRFVAPYGIADKTATLARLDTATKTWLEQHQAEIQECDFRLFDTAAPERVRPQRPKPTGVTPLPPDEPGEGEAPATQ
jgi:hypothetical protein